MPLVQRTERATEDASRYAEDGSANSQAKQRSNNKVCRDGEPKNITSQSQTHEAGGTVSKHITITDTQFEHTSEPTSCF